MWGRGARAFAPDCVLARERVPSDSPSSTGRRACRLGDTKVTWANLLHVVWRLMHGPPGALFQGGAPHLLKIVWILTQGRTAPPGFNGQTTRAAGRAVFRARPRSPS
mmetsp:Transcript_8103/g.24437  ORF Transcript_8103/g.24437 Transcript_8103/m.24437 type:complete len:107 (-) Transcript_8103:601-921(-)